ncbi:MAG: BamA/TamA family outer membrane protein [Chitinophagaceae bacterium]
MNKRSSPLYYALMAVVLGLLFFNASCNPAKHVADGDFLLRRNSLKLKSDRTLTNKGELSDALSSLIIQKPNAYFLNFIPYKVALYNLRYQRYQKDTAAINFQRNLKTVERPVVFDTALANRSAQHMQSYLFNQGYFYSRAQDTVVIRGKKLTAVYKVETGLRYLINKTQLDIDDSLVQQFVSGSMAQTVLGNGIPFSMALAEDERSRIANVLRNNGYYKFTQDNIHIVVDTFNKALLRDAANPFESAINFLASQHTERKPTVDVKIIIRKESEPNAYRRYRIGKLQIYPDFVDRKDINDSTLLDFTNGDISFHYHQYFVREKVLMHQIFMGPGQYYSQDNYDLTITKLNELGLFQYVQTYIIEDSTLPDDQNLRFIILMNPSKPFDFSINYEVTNGTTYTLGNSIGLNFRNRNLLKGANQLSISLTGGIELGYNKDGANDFVNKFYLLSRNAGINATLDFPKFIAPFSIKAFRGKAQPRTILGLGTNLLDRVDYFTLINTSANITYNWKQSSTNTWDLSPAFANILRLPRIADSFQIRLDSNEFLRNSYRQSFIEGESLYFTFSNNNGPHASRHYSYLKAGIEESGALLSAINTVVNLQNSLGLPYSQYVKLEADARHYLPRKHSTIATRVFVGFGIPYDKSSTLPYIKQYFVGGPYSLRGYRVRQLGPGSYYNPNTSQSSNFVDRTADIKIEANAEYRFGIVQLFGGSLHLNGAAFMDAGNIWLAKPSTDYPGGEFALDKIGKDIAVCVGLGARFDISSIFVLRFDEGFPIKNPDYPINGGWVLDRLQPFNKDWRNNNLVLHIAIGYPF